MVDKLPSKQRSKVMAAIRSKGMRPEMAVRRAAHGLGYRFRLHRRDLPGTPDLVFPRLQKIVFMHGCFWHGHNCDLGRRNIRTNPGYWTAKIARNQARDVAAVAALEKVGWHVLVIRECETKDPTLLRESLAAFLGRGRSSPRKA
jgi:DNA mismatch endonuclease (patch repair protein)